MWSLDNQTPYACERGFCRDRDGAELWLVVVRASFMIAPDGSTCRAEEQSQPIVEPKYLGEPGRSSLRADTDLVRTRKTTDVIVDGHAHAPRGKAVSHLEVSFSVADVSKKFRVVGDRVFERHGATIGPGAPRPFTKVPLTYERAFGGHDTAKGKWITDNPVGVGFAGDGSALVGKPAPNIESLSDSPGIWSRPVGVLPIPSDWTPRSRYAGTYDAAWLANKAPLLADDLDDRFYQTAPEDQQTASFLRGGEPVALHNLTPDGALRFELPRVALGFETVFRDDSRVHAGRLHQVLLEPDLPRVTLVFHTSLRCHGLVEQLQTTSITEKTFLPRGDQA